MRLLAVLLAIVVIAGCASGREPGRQTRQSTRTPYPGPLYRAAPVASASWSGAAGAVVQCSSAPSGGSAPSPYRGGSVGHTAEGALDDADNVVNVDVDALRVERRQGTRVLYTAVYGGIAREALVVHYGPAARGTGADDHGRGWYPESWATCDLADFPETVSSARGVEVWSDTSGARVDTRRVVSSAEDRCLGRAWLTVGKRQFVRAPLRGLEKYFAERFRRDVPLPADAVDTGWSRGTQHLWLSRARHQAYVGVSAARVESWPELTTAVGCG